MTTPTEVTLGDHTYSVAPQRYGYLRAAIGKKFSALMKDGELDLDLEASDIPSLLGDQVYDVLALLIPDLMPRHEFEGFATEEDHALGIDAYDRTKDRSPDPPEIEEALKVTMRMNKLDLLGKLKGLVGEDFLGIILRKAIFEAMDGGSPSTPVSSQNSSPVDTASPPMPSGTPELTQAA